MSESGDVIVVHHLCSAKLVKLFSKSSPVHVFKIYCPSESMSKETTLLREVHAVKPNKDGIYSFLEYCLHFLPFLLFIVLFCMYGEKGGEINQILFTTVPHLRSLYV